MWYHYQLSRNWNRCNSMDRTKLLPDDIIGDVFVYGMFCALATVVAVKNVEQIMVLQDIWVLHRKENVIQVLLLS